MDHDDFTQEAWVYILTWIDRYDPAKGGWESWAERIARHAMISACRREKHRAHVDLAQEITYPVDPPDGIERRALGMLTDSEARSVEIVLGLSGGHRRSWPHAAALIGRTREGTKSLYFRSIRKLRKAFA
jgi:RNA polymerase sigma factor (sigma-70 family)